jgi:hypothetical protein
MNIMAEYQKQVSEVSPVVQQALGKLNMRMADFMEQINVVINVLANENMELRAKLANTSQTQQQSNKESAKK